jgi:hypothetical protein
MDYPNSANAIRDFFGKGQISAVVDLPNRIDHLIAALLPGHLYTAEAFIDKNTLFSLFEPFLSQELAIDIRRRMRVSGDNNIHSKLGLKANRLPHPDRLRSCPKCAAEDVAAYGETYWHRIHQVYGVVVCPRHEVFLVDTDVPWCNERRPVEALSTPAGIQEMVAVGIDPTDQHHNILLNISRCAEWLISWHGGPIGPEEIRRRYHNLLLSRGLAYYNDRIRTGELIERFITFFTPEFLSDLKCEINSVYRNWVLRLLHQSTGEAIQHHIRHILMILFLGLTAQEFFEGFREYRPFGEGPWPCLNQATEHHRQITVTELRIQEGSKGKPGIPRGIFSCHCGFSYARYGPDEREADRLRYDSVVEYGKTWEDYFTSKWNDPEVTLSRLSVELGVIPFTLKRHAIRLKLPIQRQNRYARPTSSQVIDKYNRARDTVSQALESRKKEWANLRCEYPNAGRQALRKLSPYLYDWLQEHSSNWLEANLPAIQTPPPEPVVVDWAREDGPLADAIRAASKKIKELPGKPVRVSLKLVGEEVGRIHWLERHLIKLPLTAAALAENIETVEGFLIRRIEWATSYYLEQKKLPSRSQLCVYAGVKGRAAGELVRVQESLTAAMAVLRTF